MNTSFTIFVGLIILVCFLLVLVVMVQNPKGGGLSSSFGGSSQQLGGVQKTSDFLDKSTWILATFLLVLILLSNLSLNQNSQGLESRLINENNIEESTMESIPEVLPEITEETIDQ